MKLIFMGTPALAAEHLEAVAREHEVLCVVTQPDKPVRRGHKLEITPPPVKLRAQELNIPVLQPERARNPEFIEELRAFSPEAIAVVAFGQILPQAILDMPRDNFANGGCLNVHFSLLPRWRGAAPVQYALWHGDKETGVTVQWMAAKLDAGDVLLQETVPIEPEENSAALLERLTPIGARLLCESLRLMQNGEAPRVPQDEAGVTLCPQINKEMGRIEWSQSAQDIHNLVRAFNPWPTAWCLWRGEPLKVWQAAVSSQTVCDVPGTLHIANEGVDVATGQGSLRLQQVQPAGKPKMNALDWTRGARLDAGAGLE